MIKKFKINSLLHFSMQGTKGSASTMLDIYNGSLGFADIFVIKKENENNYFNITSIVFIIINILILLHFLSIAAGKLSPIPWMGIRFGRCGKEIHPGPHDVPDGLNSEISAQCGISVELQSSGRFEDPIWHAYLL